MEGYLFFWGAKKKNGVFSNFYSSPFTYTGKDSIRYRFKNNEQFFMWSKAILFEDFEVAERILKVGDDPATAKKLGRAVKGFNAARWDSVRYEIMKEGLTLKFTQNPPLKEALISTGDAVLVEASPYDKIWGIGMSEVSAIKAGESKWGQNLLGKALMEVRESLK